MEEKEDAILLQEFQRGGAAESTMSNQQVLILGGGLMGLAIAHQLARRGRAVTVLSRRRNEAAGFVAAGMLAPHAEGLTGAVMATLLFVTPDAADETAPSTGEYTFKLPPTSTSVSLIPTACPTP